MRPLGRALRHRPFLSLGLLTLSLFFVVEGLNILGANDAARSLAGALRVLIIPMYLAWMGTTILQVAVFGPDGLPGVLGALASTIKLASGLGPYALADYILARFRQERRADNERVL